MIFGTDLAHASSTVQISGLAGHGSQNAAHLILTKPKLEEEFHFMEEYTKGTSVLSGRRNGLLQI